jgi:PAS domain S-box-containing protein
MTVLLVLPWGLLAMLLLLGLWLLRRHEAALRVQQDLAAELRRTEQTLQRISQAVESASDAIGIGDMEANSLYHNRAHHALFGYTVDELNAVEAPGALFADPVTAQEIHRSIRSGRSWVGETEVKTKDGRRIPAFVRADIIRDMTGQPVGIFGVFRDITEDRRRAEERERTAKLESLGLLAGGIAHDFNNILTVIIGHLSLVQITSGVPAPLNERLRSIEQATWRARGLTQQLLAFSRGNELMKQRVELPAIIEESVGLAVVEAPEVRVELVMAPDLSAVEADSSQLGQVINNLALNAVQAMDRKGVLQVTARNLVLAAAKGALPAGSRVVHVSVADTGSGISPENLRKIFDPFFTTKATGTGLGLATVYAIVTRHGGRMEVESVVGRGTTFHLYLPAMAADSRDSQARAL